ncbi:MAG: sulfite exporter TauE/SafE family protein [Spirochaetales bacterium]|nr:sulfite exporter TauE/SafE family protein [Spirochaetales bacterium]
MVNIILYIILGILVGFLSGMIGIGGGIILVPALVLLFGLTQHEAQGTTVALMVPPIGLLAAWTYYKNGFVDIKIAIFVCIGFVLGSFLGANLVVGIPEVILKKGFGIVLVLVAIKMIFF